MNARARTSAILFTFASVAVTFGAWSGPLQRAERKVSYSRDVLPIFADKCFTCHGPDGSSRQAGLRLDTKEGATADRGGRRPIVPGKPDESLVVQRITSKDAPMPPHGSGKTLTAADVAMVRAWIREGADFTRVWSFEPLPDRVAVPQVASDWPRDDIDRFVLDRLDRESLRPNPPASRERWLRRVALDLTGLPPSVDDIDRFRRDKRPDAFERVVDDLLARPAYGERLAVEWLDAARYSDSYGYQSDLLMPSWPYRDWVVRAFNSNLRYDRFLTDQIAGDLLPNPTRDDRLATAFNRLHRQSNEGGSIALEFKTEYAVDRVDTFGTAVLGLTLGCARCHDHKYDPVTQREYYQLFAYFNSIDEFGLLLSTEIVPTPSLLLPTSEQEPALQLARKRFEDAQVESRKVKKVAERRFAAWLDSRPRSKDVGGSVSKFDLDAFAGGRCPDTNGGPAFAVPLLNTATTEGYRGHAVKFDGDNGLAVKGLPARERFEPFTWSFWIKDPQTSQGPVVLLHRTGGTDVGFCGFDLTLEEGRLTARVMRHWPGNAVAVRSKTALPKDRWSHVAWSWDGLGIAAGLKLYVDGRLASTEVLNDRIWKGIAAYGDLGPSGGDWAFGQRFRDAGFKGGAVDEVAFSDRALSSLEVRQLADPSAMDQALKDPRSHRTELIETFTSVIDGPARAALIAALKAQEALVRAEDPVMEVSVMEEAPQEVPAYLLARGRYDAPRTVATRVGRDVPKTLPPLPKGRRNDRLKLAKWATDLRHPLTARVAVNRFWQMLFGTGLVESSENFGVQGARPSHPELLDFLARRFVDSGWNVKRLLRSIVLSSTYRQDSTRSAGTDVDPQNRLLSRGPSGRLSAEMIRDTVLSASGLLNHKVGGPPVNPYQPAGIWQENNTMSPQFVQSKGADLYRRSLYSTWKRTTPVPSMLMFDATSREACTVRRPSTSTPLQALVLLNDVQFVEAARSLAAVALHQAGDDLSRIGEVYQRLAGRMPNAPESAVLLRCLQEQRNTFRSDRESAVKFVATGESPVPASLDPVELAAMTVTVQAVSNSDAVVWKR